MRVRLVGLLVVLLASCLAATVAVAQLSPTVPTKLPELAVSAPNLVVAKVIFSYPKPASTPASMKVSVTVRNIGTAEAMPTQLACVLLQNATDPAGLAVRALRLTPAVAADAEATVVFTIPQPLSGQVLFLCDAYPWKSGSSGDQPYGQVRERATDSGVIGALPAEAGEWDNAFVVPFDKTAATPGTSHLYRNSVVYPWTRRKPGAARDTRTIISPQRTDRPDLIIVQATVSRAPAASPTAVPALRVSAIVRNIGTLAAGPATLVCLQSPARLYTFDMFMGGRAAIPALKPDTAATVNVDVMAFPYGSLVLVADAPGDWNQPFGKVSEGAGPLTLAGTKSEAEWNNAFSFPFDNTWTLPKDFAR